MKTKAACISFATMLGLSLILPILFPPVSETQSHNQVRGLKIIKTLPDKSKRFALVIGVDEYRDKQINRLYGAAKDARTLAAALVKYAGFPEDQVTLLATGEPEEREPSRANILQRLLNLKGLVPQDGLLFVSFAGHGMQRGERAFLLPSDVKFGSLSLLENTSVSVSQMKELIRQTGAKQVLVILDACRNDPSGRAEAANPMSRAYRFDFETRNQEVEAFATIYATEVGERAYEYTEKNQGYFTWTLVEGLAGEAANERGEVTLSGLVRYLQEKVPKRVLMDLGQEKKQRPWAEIQGYKADELIISITVRLTATNSSSTNPTGMQPAPSGPDKQGNIDLQTYIETAASVAIEMVRVPAGKFMMGSSDHDWSNEYPQHEVSVSSFYMGKYEVTQEQWRAVATRLPKVKIDLNPDPSNFKGDNLPGENVSWGEATEFCDRLSKATGRTYRLPTEAEWEYTCRAGTRDEWAGNLDEIAWYKPNSGGRPHPVGTKKPNGFGLYDMHGNVYEWCVDDYDHDYYRLSPSVNPANLYGSEFKVIRGGNWEGDAYYNLPSSARLGQRANEDSSQIGFRLARNLY